MYSEINAVVLGMNRSTAEHVITSTAAIILKQMTIDGAISAGEVCLTGGSDEHVAIDLRYRFTNAGRDHVTGMRFRLRADRPASPI